MSIERRVIVGATKRERVAIVSILIPAGGEVEIERTWRVLGWQDEMKIKIRKPIARVHVDKHGRARKKP